MLPGITPNIINAIYTEIVDINVENLNLETLFTSNQRNSFKTKRVIIKSGVEVYSMSRSLNALNTGNNWNGLLEIVNYGGIYGAAGINSGDSGGNACIAQYASTKLINRGNIWSGGGAGGNGGNGGGGYYSDGVTEGPRWDGGNGWRCFAYDPDTLYQIWWNGSIIYQYGASSPGGWVSHPASALGVGWSVGGVIYYPGARTPQYEHRYVYRYYVTTIYTSGGIAGNGGRGQGYDGAATVGAGAVPGGTNAGAGGKGGNGGTWGMPGQNGASGGNGNNGSGGLGIAGGLAGYAHFGFNQVSNLGSVLGRI